VGKKNCNKAKHRNSSYSSSSSTQQLPINRIGINKEKFLIICGEEERKKINVFFSLQKINKNNQSAITQSDTSCIVRMRI